MQVAHLDGVAAEPGRPGFADRSRCASRSGRVGALTVPRSATSGLGDRRLRLLDRPRPPGEARDRDRRPATRCLERTFVSTVAALANALEANDAYASSHARWITDMALLVGRELRARPGQR